MNIVITGSLGHISKPLAHTLLQKGHTVTIISSKAERRQDIEGIGAKAAIGTMEDAAFLSRAFAGADIVYAMEALPSHSFTDPDFNVRAAICEIANSYKTAIEQAGVKRVVHLSSIGAHTDTGNGILAFHYDAEQILNSLSADVAIKIMRPVGFYYNLYAFLPVIRAQGAIVTNYGGDDKEPWVAPADIAAVIAEEMEKPFEGREIRYIASDEVSPNEVAQALGAAIGKPDLKWTAISDEQALNGLLAAGMDPQTAKGFVEMNASRRGGVLYQDYDLHRPAPGVVKLADFAKEFAIVYNQQ
jgi:uncharacterized protein YbjT (DUF2867 family)